MIAGVLSVLTRLAAFTALLLVLAPVQIIALVFGLRLARRMPILFHRGIMALLGIQAVVHGVPARQGRVLYLSNHCSYLDIPILGGLIEASFVSKAEVAGWPILGWLAWMQRTVFIDRRAVRRVKEQRDRLAGRMAAGDNLILFPEGTSSDGNRVLPFKSALLSAAEADSGAKPVMIQPVSLAYSRLDGMPMGRAMRPAFAWYGAMDLLPHAARLLFQGALTVDVVFHPVMPATEFASRKDMAARCRDIVANGVAEALYGRSWPVSAKPRVPPARPRARPSGLSAMP